MKSNHCRAQRLIASSIAALCALSFDMSLAQTPPAAPATAPATAPLADPEKGNQLFQQRCSLCHAVDASAVAQGPPLNGVVGRASASLAEFPYTDVLRWMRVTWDEKSLDRFLANPMLVAPGTSMPIGLPDSKERRDVIAYLTTLSPGASNREELSAAASNDPGHWRYAKPGMTYRIDVDALPKPYASRSTGNFPRVVDQPADTPLSAPEGFIVKPFATQLGGPRTIRVAPNGEVEFTVQFWRRAQRSTD